MLCQCVLCVQKSWKGLCSVTLLRKIREVICHVISSSKQILTLVPLSKFFCGCEFKLRSFAVCRLWVKWLESLMIHWSRVENYWVHMQTKLVHIWGHWWEWMIPQIMYSVRSDWSDSIIGWIIWVNTHCIDTEHKMPKFRAVFSRFQQQERSKPSLFICNVHSI